MDDWADTQIPVDGTEGCLPALVKLKRERYPHLRVILSIGGGAGSAQFPAVAADRGRTKRFCETVVLMVQRYQLDGIDSRWSQCLTIYRHKSIASHAEISRLGQSTGSIPKHKHKVQTS